MEPRGMAAPAALCCGMIMLLWMLVGALQRPVAGYAACLPAHRRSSFAARGG